MSEAVGEVSGGGFRGAIRAPGFRRLLIGQAVSSLGDWVATLAFIVAAFALTNGNQTAVAVVLVLRLVPPIFAAPVGGVVADRAYRRGRDGGVPIRLGQTRTSFARLRIGRVDVRRWRALRGGHRLHPPDARRQRRRVRLADRAVGNGHGGWTGDRPRADQGSRTRRDVPAGRDAVRRGSAGDGPAAVPVAFLRRRRRVRGGVLGGHPS